MTVAEHVWLKPHPTRVTHSAGHHAARVLVRDHGDPMYAGTRNVGDRGGMWYRGCLFTMCNRHRYQIRSIKSINDSIVQSDCNTARIVLNYWTSGLRYAWILRFAENNRCLHRSLLFLRLKGDQLIPCSQLHYTTHRSSTEDSFVVLLILPQRDAVEPPQWREICEWRSIWHCRLWWFVRWVPRCTRDTVGNLDNCTCLLWQSIRQATTLSTCYRSPRSRACDCNSNWFDEEQSRFQNCNHIEETDRPRTDLWLLRCISPL